MGSGIGVRLRDITYGRLPEVDIAEFAPVGQGASIVSLECNGTVFGKHPALRWRICACGRQLPELDCLQMMLEPHKKEHA